jgi:HAMP domain-containing protein
MMVFFKLPLRQYSSMRLCAVLMLSVPGFIGVSLYQLQMTQDFSRDLAAVGVQAVPVSLAGHYPADGAMSKVQRDLSLWSQTLLWRLAFALALSCFAVVAVIVWLINPVLLLAQCGRALADGNFETVVPYAYRKDEWGAIAKALGMIPAENNERLALQGERAGAASDIEIERRRALNRMARMIETESAASVADIFGNMGRMSAEVADTVRIASNLGSTADKMAEAASSALSNAMGIEDAGEMLGASIHEIKTLAAKAIHDRQLVATGQPDRQRRRVDRRHCRTDEPAGAERHDRSGTRRRSGAGLCGRRVRGEKPGPSDGRVDEADQTADCRYLPLRRTGRGCGSSVRRDDRRGFSNLRLGQRCGAPTAGSNRQDRGKRRRHDRRGKRRRRAGLPGVQ